MVCSLIFENNLPTFFCMLILYGSIETMQGVQKTVGNADFAFFCCTQKKSFLCSIIHMVTLMFKFIELEQNLLFIPWYGLLL